ncbi:MAG: hypothetical protein ABGY96_14890 [bacterium]|nr:hypothetical protein [Gammaproteobacteria bacterium]HIL96444.1 hypothetical protein [Pseudomonadales bacterium]
MRKIAAFFQWKQRINQILLLLYEERNSVGIESHNLKAKGSTMNVKLAANLWILMLIIPSQKLQADEVVKETAAGGINWTQGVVFANGYGTAKPGMSEAQSKLLARRAAIVDGQRNLLEITRGVRIDSTLITDQLMNESRETTTKIEGIIKGARVIEENYQNDIATVTLAMPIAGQFLQVAWPDRANTARSNNHLPAPSWSKIQTQRLLLSMGAVGSQFLDALVPLAHASSPITIRKESEVEAYRRLLEWMQQGSDIQDGQAIDEMLNEAISNYQTNNQFSGLLINASGVTDFELATIPKIRDDEGNIIYPNEGTSYSDIVNNRGVSYDFDLNDAIKDRRVATSPFIIKALSTYKNFSSDLIISKQDAARVQQSPSTMEAMNKAGVLIVVAI